MVFKGYLDCLHNFVFQRLAGATLLVFANKQDLPGALSAEDIRQVSGLLNINQYKFFAFARF